MSVQEVALVLADGSVYPGEGFGAEPPHLEDLTDASARGIGELVFNTAMTGYHEIGTDPSYAGQIVVMTYPHLGNYGTDPDWDESLDGAPLRLGLAGMVARSLYDGPLPSGRLSISDWLAAHGVPGITEVDTRAITLRIRDHGSPNAAIVRAGDTDRARAILGSFPLMEGRELVSRVRVGAPLRINPGGSPRIALVDCGAKASIVSQLVQRGAEVILVTSADGAGPILNEHPDAVLFSNGPGDPAVLPTEVGLARELRGRTTLLGICLGHQLLGQALGLSTFKMRFGHHGGNQPVRDEETGRVFVTSQNHGFAVDEDNLPDGARVWFRNANDGSVEGISWQGERLWAVQFHPEAGPGPHDARWIFDRFIEIARSGGTRSGNPSTTAGRPDPPAAAGTAGEGAN